MLRSCFSSSLYFMRTSVLQDVYIITRIITYVNTFT
nr:MAG TPA: hypothetical protein [Caudoviricetes sp.]